MKQKSSVTAQKLLNLYRNQHVIFGGWEAINRVFIADATDPVIADLRAMPAGRFLIAHIENLRSGKTPMNSISQDLMPYGGLMTESVASTNLTDAEINELKSALNSFVPDSDGLDKIQSLNVVRKFGDEWLVAIRSALSSYPDMLQKWTDVIRTARAYYLWKIANDILGSPINERTRARVQADLPEFETYLPMFGDAGREVLSKLRIFVSSL